MKLRDKRRVFAMLNRGNQRRVKVDEAKSDSMPEIMQEIIGMNANLEAVKTLQDVVGTAIIKGEQAQKVAQALFFLQGMRVGTEGRIKELEAKLVPPSKPLVEVAQGEPVSAA